MGNDARLSAIVVVRDKAGVPSAVKRISFDDKCPLCGATGLIVKDVRDCRKGEWDNTDHIYCPRGCQFGFRDLVNLIVAGGLHEKDRKEGNKKDDKGGREKG